MKNRRFQTIVLLFLAVFIFFAAGLRTSERIILDYQGEEYAVKLVSKNGGWLVTTTGSATGPRMIQKSGGLVEILSILKPSRKVLVQDDLVGGKYEIEVLTKSAPVEDVLPLVFSQVIDAMGLQYVKTSVEEEGICIIKANTPVQPGPSGVNKSIRAMEIGPYNSVALEGHTLTEIKEYFFREYEFHLNFKPAMESGNKYNLEVKFTTLGGLVEELNEQGFSARECNVSLPAILIKEE